MHVINKLIDLGYSFETFKANNMSQQNPFPKNPMLLSKIKDALMGITYCVTSIDSKWWNAVLSTARTNPTACVSILFGEADKNRSKVVDLIGEKTLALIEEYMNDEKDDIPEGLFNQGTKDSEGMYGVGC